MPPARPPKPRLDKLEKIWGQGLIAFGQGTGTIRIHLKTVEKIHAIFRPVLAKASRRWEADAVQALERIRTIGRVAALNATLRGDTVISPEDFQKAARVVAAGSGTPLCP